MIFGLFKKRYPLARLDMIEPLDLPISATEAKKFYRWFVKEIGFATDRQDIADGARYLGDEIKYWQQALKDECEQYAADLKEAKANLAEAEKRLAKCRDADMREDLEVDVADCRSDVDTISEDLAKAKRELADFKNDKRAFVIDYINQEVQGPDWKPDARR